MKKPNCGEAVSKEASIVGQEWPERQCVALENSWVGEKLVVEEVLVGRWGVVWA